MLRFSLSTFRKIALAFTLAIPAVTPAMAEEIGFAQGMEEMGPARAPIGHVDFCRREPQACASARLAPQRIVLDAEAMAELRRINDYVNTNIAPITDQDLYGVEEYWTYPRDRGDCEDYALLKQRFLIDAGWPESALLVTVVRDEKGDGHAVLTVVTDRGDYVLDNQREPVLAWQDTGYDFVKRQSQTNVRQWVFLGGGQTGVGVASARQR